MKNKDSIVKELIYEVSPISMLNYSKEDLENVLAVYTQFLKLIDVKYKILIRNVKFDKNEYIDKHFKNDIASSELYKNYVDSIKLKIDKEDIYTVKIYICFICKDFQEKIIEDGLNKLNSIGINVTKLAKEEVRDLLYKTINKL